jgi:hypothetical protein
LTLGISLVHSLILMGSIKNSRSRNEPVVKKAGKEQATRT